MTFVYTLNLGLSTDGGSVHPVDELGTLPSLDAAKAVAEQEAGKPLHWRWMENRQCWRAEVGHDRAAEIWKGTVLERIDVGGRTDDLSICAAGRGGERVGRLRTHER